MSPAERAAIIKGLVILVADGKLHSRTLLRSMLLQLGAKSIYEVADGAALLDAIRTIRPDAVIVDWDVPVVDAREVLSVMRAPGAFSNPNIPIIVISSSSQGDYVREAISLGAKQFLVRPISLKILEERLLGVVTVARKALHAVQQNMETLQQVEVID